MTDKMDGKKETEPSRDSSPLPSLDNERGAEDNAVNNERDPSDNIAPAEMSGLPEERVIACDDPPPPEADDSDVRDIDVELVSPMEPEMKGQKPGVQLPNNKHAKTDPFLPVGQQPDEATILFPALDLTPGKADKVVMTSQQLIDHSFLNMNRVVEATNPNYYATVKTVAQGVMDLSLLMSHCKILQQLTQGGPDSRNSYYCILSLLIISIVLQISTALLLCWIAVTDINKGIFRAAEAVHRGQKYREKGVPNPACCACGVGDEESNKKCCSCCNNLTPSRLNNIACLLLILIAALNVLVNTL